MSTPSKSKTSPRIDIQVTQDVIDTAQRRDSSHCMIADAIQATVPDARYISVDLATIRFTDLAAGKRYVYLTPRPAQAALLAFDQGEKSEPFNFRIQSAHVLATGNARKARASLEPQQSPGSTSGTMPERRDGQSPPIGPLAGGAPTNRRDRRSTGIGAGSPAAVRTGRRRQFGLRAVIR